eukprot:scaffold3471_cov175-Amphora_coffeaeformis.AAC.15
METIAIDVKVSVFWSMLQLADISPFKIYSECLRSEKNEQPTRSQKGYEEHQSSTGMMKKGSRVQRMYERSFIVQGCHAGLYIAPAI